MASRSACNESLVLFLIPPRLLPPPIRVAEDPQCQQFKATYQSLCPQAWVGLFNFLWGEGENSTQGDFPFCFWFCGFVLTNFSQLVLRSNRRRRTPGSSRSPRACTRPTLVARPLPATATNFRTFCVFVFGNVHNAKIGVKSGGSAPRRLRGRNPAGV